MPYEKTYVCKNVLFPNIKAYCDHTNYHKVCFWPPKVCNSAAKEILNQSSYLLRKSLADLVL